MLKLSTINWYNFSDAFPSLEQDGSSGFAGAGAGGSKTDSPINGQNSLYFDPQNKAVSGTNPTTYLGGLGSTTRWKELPKEDFVRISNEDYKKYKEYQRGRYSDNQIIM